MFSSMWSFITNLFSDCTKYREEPTYHEIIENQQNEYYSRNKVSIDPLWQDRRLLSFFHYTPKKKSMVSI